MGDLSPATRAIGDQVIASIRDFVGRATAPLIARLDQHARRAESTDMLLADLERRVAELEAKR